MQRQCGLCSALAEVFRRVMCIGASRRGSADSYYQELPPQPATAASTASQPPQPVSCCSVTCGCWARDSECRLSVLAMHLVLRHREPGLLRSTWPGRLAEEAM
ncbi:hypothetical protein LSTR_LSTR001819, partial [Laodelphax striatellus]